MGYYFVTLKNHKGYQFHFRTPLIWVTYTLMPPCENILCKVTFSQEVYVRNITLSLLCYSRYYHYYYYSFAPRLAPKAENCQFCTLEEIDQ